MKERGDYKKLHSKMLKQRREHIDKGLTGLYHHGGFCNVRFKVIQVRSKDRKGLKHLPLSLSVPMLVAHQCPSGS